MLISTNRGRSHFESQSQRAHSCTTSSSGYTSNMSLPEYYPPAAPSDPLSSARLAGMRSAVHGLFSSVSRTGPQAQTPESPKTPTLPPYLPEISASRLIIPPVARTNTRSSNSSTHISPVSLRSDSASSSPSSVRPITPNSFRDIQHAGSESPGSSTRFVGVNTAEQGLSDVIGSGRGRMNAGNKANRRCFPNKSKRVRAKMTSCLASGLFLAVTLTLCTYRRSCLLHHALHAHTSTN